MFDFFGLPESSSTYITSNKQTVPKKSKIFFLDDEILHLAYFKIWFYEYVKCKAAMLVKKSIEIKFQFQFF